jgi:hypothetical protein
MEILIVEFVIKNKNEKGIFFQAFFFFLKYSALYGMPNKLQYMIILGMINSHLEDGIG